MLAIFKNCRIAVKLPLLVALGAAVLAMSVGYAAYHSADSALRAEANTKLMSLAQTRASALRDYVRSLGEDLQLMSTNTAVISALKEMRTGYSVLGDEATAALQQTFIDGNPFPVSERAKLTDSRQSRYYDKMHARQHPWFRRALELRGYYDIFLFDTAGNVIYTVVKENDFATNVMTGKWKDTDLASVYKAAMASQEFQISLTDLHAYAPGAGLPASFMATPVYDGLEKIGVIAVQMPTERLNALFNGKSGLGATGETLLVGSDGYLRVDSAFVEGDDILHNGFGRA